MVMRKLFVLALFILLTIGCFEKPVYEVDYNISVGKPYSINSSDIGFREDVTVDVSITNTQGRQVTLTIENTTLESRFPDGSEETVYGNVKEQQLILRPNETGVLTISFNGVPMLYRLKSNPLRLESMGNYTVKVNYTGRARLFGIIPVSDIATYNQTISPKTIELEEFIAKQEVF
ncbi:MAG: hypothetical protein D6733_07445 [Methanobacteriota archaeon]|nr:MAG: hypothetical protein D6733_07445 [Euryarchaeota archaeon]